VFHYNIDKKNEIGWEDRRQNESRKYSSQTITYIQGKVISVRMTGNVTCTTRVLVLQPSTTNVAVLLINDMFDILARLLDMVGH